MTWIKTSPPGPENLAVVEALQQGMAGYPREYDPSTKPERRVPDAVRSDDIVMAHSLIPSAMRHVFAAYSALLDPALPLSRRQHEMIAATVSSLNQCLY